jgi:autotransporter adhesin
MGNTASASNGGSAFGDFSNATCPGCVANVSSSTAIGNTASATTANSVAVGQSANVQAANGSAFGANAVVQASATNSVAIGQGSVASAPNTVSVGAAGSERRVTNVAAGIAPTDAVNVSQLTNTAAGFTGITSGLQSQITGLQGQIFDNRSEARRGIAAAVATASAPMPSAPGKTTWQLRASTFQGETGLGFGVAHRLNLNIPLDVIAGYGNGGGNQHTAYVGVGGEF